MSSHRTPWFQALARLVGLVLAALVGIVGVAVPAQAAPASDPAAEPSNAFTDVPPGTQFYREMNWMSVQKISTGYDDGTYRPLQPVNRDAMAAFMYRLAGEPEFTAPSRSPFVDVPVGTAFYKEMAWMAAEKISTGYDDGTYRPLAPVNRDAMAAFMYRLAGEPEFTAPPRSPFVDVPVGTAFYKEMAWMAAEGISTGYEDRTYRPTTPVNRDAMAAFMYRLDLVMKLRATNSDITTGRRFSCATTPAGAVRCWGGNTYGQLGNGTTGGRSVRPVPVTGLTSGVRSVDAGADYACALTQEGAVRCWGSNAYGQLGTGTVGGSSSTPTQVVGLTSGVRAIAIGDFHACAVTRTGVVQCWGDNVSGQVGDGTIIERSRPVTVANLGDGIRGVSLGTTHTCAVTDLGALRCWGDNWAGQLGDGTTDTRYRPVTVQGLARSRVVTAGADFTCAIGNDDVVRCWGDNSQNQLGDGTLDASLTPVRAVGVEGATRLDSGTLHTCAVTDRGAAVCWGGNPTGQLGDGTISNGEVGRKPKAITGLGTTVRSISGSWFHGCASRTTGSFSCWGRNADGQLGDGTTTDRLTPVDVRGI